MAKEAYEKEQEFIQTAQDKTGKTLAEWLATIEASAHRQTNAIIKWLKSDHGLNHMQAAILAGIYLNDGQPVFIPEVLLNKLFDGKEQQRPFYKALARRIQAADQRILLIPTKTYVSLEDERVFGCIKLNKTNLRVGLDLGDRPFDDTVVAAKGLGAMPNIGHMVELTSPDDITDDLIDLIQSAYARAHA